MYQQDFPLQMFPSHFCLSHLILRCLSTCFCAQILGGHISFFLSRSALTDSASLSPPLRFNLQWLPAKLSCVPANFPSMYRFKMAPSGSLLSGFTVGSRMLSQQVGRILFYLIVLNAVPSKWRLLLTRVISYLWLLFDHSKHFKAAPAPLETHGCKGGPLVERESARLWSHSKQKREGHFVHFWRNNIWEIK